MTGLIIAAAIVLFLVLLLLLPISVRVTAHPDPTVTLKILFVKIRLYPQKPSVRKLRKKRDKEEQKEEKSKKSDIRHIPVKEIVSEVTRISREIIRKFRGKIKVRLKRVRIIVATDDPAKTAILFGAVSAGVAGLSTLLESLVRVKTNRSSDLTVTTDFIGDKSSVDIDIDFPTNPLHLLILSVGAFRTYLSAKARLRKTKSK